MVAAIANLIRGRFLVAAVVMLAYASGAQAQLTNFATSMGATSGFVYTDNGSGASGAISASETLPGFIGFLWSASFASAHGLAGTDSSSGATVTETISIASPGNTTQTVNNSSGNLQQGFNNQVTITFRNTTLGKNLLVITFTNTSASEGLVGATTSTQGSLLGDSALANQVVSFSSDFPGLFTNVTEEKFTDSLSMSQVLTPDPSGTKAFLSFTANEVGSFQVAVPEPNAMLLMGTVALGLGVVQRVRRFRKGAGTAQQLPAGPPDSGA